MQYSPNLQISSRIIAKTVKSSYPNRLNPSTPNVGTSTHLNAGTPSALLLSTKLLHSPTTRPHSASARPAYFALFPLSMPPFPNLGSLAPTSRLMPGTFAEIHAWAGAGRRGGHSLRSEVEVERPRVCLWCGSLVGFSKCWDHSRENLKE